MQYQRAIISVPSLEESETILSTLLEKHLVAGGNIAETKAQYWWKDEIARESYWEVSCYTTSDKKEGIIDVVKNMHSDEVPAISFYEIEGGSSGFLEWISEAVS